MQRLIILLLLLASPAFAQDGEPEKGFFKVSLTPVQLLGEEGAASLSQVFDKHEVLQYQLYVPQSYSAESPAGVIVYISPWERGGLPRSWNSVMRDKNMIWIGAENAGNETPVAKRMFLAMLAPMVLQQHYVMNPDRVYIAGYSGGAKTASRVAALRPNMFKGGIFMSGAHFWGRETPPLIEQIRQLRYVFISGSNDFALDEVRDGYRAFRAAGVDNVDLIVVPNQRHERPDSVNFGRAIDHLDARVGVHFPSGD